MISHSECAKSVKRLAESLIRLQKATSLLKTDPLEGREWFELLNQKLVPQLTDDAFLVVAVVGGTNIGKSVTFNHIAGYRASASSPLASGTRHPVCLVPTGFEKRHDLQAIFSGFDLEPWTDPSAALSTTEEHKLFWRSTDEIADNLLILDTPDIDSDAPINWVRADAVRRSADVLIAVLTQQKYNDAAVKKFFRQAAEEDKAIIIVFNQVLLPDDEQYWPVWLKTFCDETGVNPEYVYIAPNDRQAAEEIRLRYMERTWPYDPDAPVSDEGHSLSDDFARLRFREIKMRTLRGSLQQLVREDSGIPAYLREVSGRSQNLAQAAKRLTSENVFPEDWPPLPNRVLVDEIRAWWRSRQDGWARTINGAYDTLGKGVTVPFQFLRNKISGEPVPLLTQYREKEWQTVLDSVEKLFDILSIMTDQGNEILKPRLEKMMKGKSTSVLLEKLRAAHEKVDLEIELETLVNAEMKRFKDDSPDLYTFYKHLNSVSAAVRPMTSVVLFTLGWGPAGEAVAPFVADAAAQAVVPIVVDLAGGTTAAVAGEAVVTEAAGGGAGWMQAYFQNLQKLFQAQRAQWLGDFFRKELLGSFPQELSEASRVPDSQEFAAIAQEIQTLNKELANDARA